MDYQDFQRYHKFILNLVKQGQVVTEYDVPIFYDYSIREIPAGSTVSLMDSIGEESGFLDCACIDVKAPDGSQLCVDTSNMMFWLKKKNQNQKYWEKRHPDDCNFVVIPLAYQASKYQPHFGGPRGQESFDFDYEHHSRLCLAEIVSLAAKQIEAVSETDTL